MIAAYAFPLGNLPIQLRCYQDGSVAFNRTHNFATIIDSPEGGLQAVLSNQDIFIGSKCEVEYNVRHYYNDMPELKDWLVGQGLQMPVFN